MGSTSVFALLFARIARMQFRHAEALTASATVSFRVFECIDVHQKPLFWMLFSFASPQHVRFAELPEKVVEPDRERGR